MLTRQVKIGRSLAAAVLAAVLLCVSLTVCWTHAISVLEFNWSVPGRDLVKQVELDSLDLTPSITATYRNIYPYAWLIPSLGLLWAAWILRKATCSLLAVVVFVGVYLNITVVWTLFTLLALYLENQRFYC
jgi:hypothetical protein